jgi:DNA-binding NtrC family response regulator
MINVAYLDDEFDQRHRDLVTSACAHLSTTLGVPVEAAFIGPAECETSELLWLADDGAPATPGLDQEALPARADLLRLSETPATLFLIDVYWGRFVDYGVRLARYLARRRKVPVAHILLYTNFDTGLHAVATDVCWRTYLEKKKYGRTGFADGTTGGLSLAEALYQPAWELLNEAQRRTLRASTALLPGVVGGSVAMQDVAHLVRRVAPHDTTVLIKGGSGTGKELIAHAIHTSSLRKDGPFVERNCAAIPDTLIEDELFGHERGAYTDAAGEKAGWFALAQGGTLFLDEIGELSAAVQAKLLRVLQDGTFQRVGGTSTIQANARIIAATNKDLRSEVKAGRFREDLYYRLAVFPLDLPTLAQRRDDIPLLATHFLRHFAEKQSRTLTWSSDALQAMTMYAWPGNVRELQHVVERAVLLFTSPAGTIHADLIGQVLPQLGSAPSVEVRSFEAPPSAEGSPDAHTAQRQPFAFLESLSTTARGLGYYGDRLRMKLRYLLEDVARTRDAGSVAIVQDLVTLMANMPSLPESRDESTRSFFRLVALLLEWAHRNERAAFPYAAFHTNAAMLENYAQSFVGRGKENRALESFLSHFARKNLNIASPLVDATSLATSGGLSSSRATDAAF